MNRHIASQLPATDIGVGVARGQVQAGSPRAVPILLASWDNREFVLQRVCDLLLGNADTLVPGAAGHAAGGHGAVGRRAPRGDKQDLLLRPFSVVVIAANDAGPTTSPGTVVTEDMMDTVYAHATALTSLLNAKILQEFGHCINRVLWRAKTGTRRSSTCHPAISVSLDTRDAADVIVIISSEHKRSMKV